MPLKYKFKTKGEIPAEREGAWVLDVHGAVEKSKLDEFRNNNVALAKERDESPPLGRLDPRNVRLSGSRTPSKQQT